MVRVGIVGVGFMGWIHWLAYQKVAAAEVKAISTRDPKKLAGDWTSIQGNFGPPGEQVDLAGVATYENVDELIADPDIDVVDICLPPHLHADIAVKVLEAGKHAFVEKPLAVSAEDCDRIVAAAEKSGKQLLVGHVLPLLPEYTYLHEKAVEGSWGKLLGGSFKRVISDPTWLPDFYDAKQVGGPLIDLHVHDAHLIRLLFGMPTAVFSQGRMRGDVVEYCNTLFQFEDENLVVNASSGVIQQQGRGFTHGFEVHFEKATAQYELAVVDGEGKILMPLTIFHEDGSCETPDMGEGDAMLIAFEHEIQAVVDSVESGDTCPMLSGQLARDAVILCHRQTESVSQRKLINV